MMHDSQTDDRRPGEQHGDFLERKLVEVQNKFNEAHLNGNDARMAQHFEELAELMTDAVDSLQQAEADHYNDQIGG